MRIKAALQATGLAVLISAPSAYAGHGHAHSSAEAGHDEAHRHSHAVVEAETEAKIDYPNIESNQMVVQVHGIVCSFCAQGVKKKLMKFDFIDHTQLGDGILVDIANQRVTVAVLQEKAIDMEGMFDAIQSGGYEPIKAFVCDADGKINIVNPKKNP